MAAPYEGFTAAAAAALVAHDWPGNVRELKNVAERSFYRWIIDDRFGPVDAIVIDPFADLVGLPISLTSDMASQKAPLDNSDRNAAPSSSALPPPLSPEEPFDLRAYLDEVEKKATQDALTSVNGNQTEAAKNLGLSYDQLRGIVRKHKLR